MEAILRWVLVGAAAAAFGCASPQYEYAPLRTTSAELGGGGEAVYRASGNGEIRLSLVGRPARVVHIRLVATNRGQDTWRVDPSAQRLEAGRLSIRATASTTVIEIPPSSTRTVDLFFAIPDPVAEPGALGAFDIAWTAQIGDRTRSERTTFERFLEGGRAPRLTPSPEPSP